MPIVGPLDGPSLVGSHLHSYERDEDMGIGGYGTVLVSPDEIKFLQF
jgi:hypothetical protein